MVNKKRQLLFFGELPPDSLHGVAISNAINLRFLKSEFHTDIVREKVRFSQHNKISFFKFFSTLRNISGIFIKSIKSHYDYFYLVYSLSVFGGIKTLFSLIAFKISNRGEVVLHLHRGDFFSRYCANPVNRLLSIWIFNLSDKLIILSEGQKPDFEKLSKMPVFVLPNTIEQEYSYKNKGENISRFVYISNYLEEKGILDLLSVFKSLVALRPTLYLSTYGNFSDPQLKDTILRFASENISINEAIYGENKFRKLSEAGAVILPSWNEGQPLVILEALSVGTPVIVTDTGFIKDITGDDYAFLCRPGDRNSLESAILKFLQCNDFKDLSDNALDIYTEKFSHSCHKEILRKIFM